MDSLHDMQIAHGDHEPWSSSSSSFVPRPRKGELKNEDDGRGRRTRTSRQALRDFALRAGRFMDRGPQPSAAASGDHPGEPGEARR